MDNNIENLVTEEVTENMEAAATEESVEETGAEAVADEQTGATEEPKKLYTEEELNLLEQEEKAQAQEIKYDESLFTVPGASKFKRDQRIPVDISKL